MFFPTGFAKSASVAILSFVFVAITGSVHSDEVSAGGYVTLTVTVDGTAPFSYQWRKDGLPINGASSAMYSITNVQSADSGDYSVVVSNSAGSVTAPSATLVVQSKTAIVPSVPNNVAAVPTVPDDVTTPSPTVTNQPVTPVAIQPLSQIATIGHDATFTAGGTGVIGQWQVSSDGGSTWANVATDSHYSGVATGTLVIANVSPTLSGYKYRFVTSGSTSSAVSLSVAAAFFPFPVGIAADGSGNVYVSDTSTDTVQKISLSGVVTLVAGSSGQTGTADGSGVNARFNDPAGLSSSRDGTLSVCDNANGTIRRITSDGTVSTFAGSTTKRGNGDGSGNAATFSSPLAVSQDTVGNLYVADALNNTVRKITAAGTVSTLAGTAGFSGAVDGSGGDTRFNHPTGIVVDAAGTVYVADTTNNVIRKITAAGVVSTFAGLAGVSGFQDGVGGEALFNSPSGLAVDSSGNVYVTDTGNSTIRKIATNGTVSTLAGLPGIAGLMDGQGSDAWFNQPKGLVLDSTGNLCVADTGNAAIRRVSLAGLVSTLTLSAGAAAVSAPAASTTVESSSSSTVGVSSSVGSQATSSGGGGGGGAMNAWFAAGLFLIGFLRWCFTVPPSPRSKRF